MKKIFTLIAMALIAIGVNAKQTIDFSSKFPYGETIQFGSWQWIGLVLADSNPIVNEADKTADDSNVTYFDASAYDYLCIKYKESTVAFQVIMQYKCLGTVGQYGAEFDQSQVDITNNTSGLVAIKLDAEKKKTINQVAVQSKGAGSITIEEIYWASEAEYTTDAANNPVVKWVPETKNLNLSEATGGWGAKTYDTSTYMASLGSGGGASGWWIGGDFSDYDYFVIEVENLVIGGGWAQVNIFNQGIPFAFDGSFIQVIDITQMNRNTTDTKIYEHNGTNCVIQGNEGTSWTWKKAYFATADYVTKNNIHNQVIYGDTKEFALSSLYAWKDGDDARATFDATTGVLSIITEGGGAGWWLNSIDFSHFDNFVVELESTTFGGQVNVEYAEADAAGARRAIESSSVKFGVGATCVVVPLDPANKDRVKQLCIQGDKGSSYTIKKAYLAVASATPEAQIGTITAISTVKADEKNAVRYNVAGQKVDAGYKGLVIMNGHTVVVK